MCVSADDCEMTELKRRLMETEAQMSRILQAMEVVQQKVGAATEDTDQLMVINCCALIVIVPGSGWSQCPATCSHIVQVVAGVTADQSAATLHSLHCFLLVHCCAAVSK